MPKIKDPKHFADIPPNYILHTTYNRRYCVQIKGNCSDAVKCEMGVPQGSVLGPLLFLNNVYHLQSASEDGYRWRVL